MDTLAGLEIQKERFQKRPLRVEVYEVLRAAIIEGRLRPRQKLNEVDLGNHLGISRTPVREALMQLEKEGLVTIDPGKGAAIAEISRSDLVEIYPIVSVLEGLAARKAATNLTFEDLSGMKDLNRQLKDLAKRGDASAYMEANSRLHQVFLDKYPNERLRDLIASYKGQIHRFRLFSLNLPGRMQESVLEHDRIIVAFEKRDASRVEHLVRKHVEEGGTVLLQKLSESDAKELEVQ